MIDLRSDTLTRPTAAMRAAMAAAKVGDDVFGEDPTVRALERRTAELLGKEAALYVPSGTMANQLALRVHTEPGDEVLTEAMSHVANYERGAPALLSGVTVRGIPGPGDGLIDPDRLRAAFRRPGRYAPAEWSRRSACSCWRIPTTPAAARSGRSPNCARSRGSRASRACGSTSTGRGCGTRPSPRACRRPRSRPSSTR